jgi:hypothetical protein
MQPNLSGRDSASSVEAQRSRIFVGSDTRRRAIRRKAAQATAGGPVAQRRGSGSRPTGPSTCASFGPGRDSLADGPAPTGGTSSRRRWWPGDSAPVPAYMQHHIIPSCQTGSENPPCPGSSPAAPGGSGPSTRPPRRPVRPGTATAVRRGRRRG